MTDEIEIDEIEVECSICGWLFWTDKDKPPFVCPTCSDKGTHIPAKLLRD